MSKREINAPGWASAPQSHMATDPSVGRFSNDQTVSLVANGPSAKFSDNDRTKSLATFSNYGQHSQQPSQRPAGTDIVDLRTAPESEWKTNPLNGPSTKGGAVSVSSSLLSQASLKPRV